MLSKNKLGYFCGKNYFDEGGTQNWLVFQPIQKIISTIDSNILSWKSKELSDESIKPPTTSNKLLNPSLNFVDTKARLKFTGSVLQQEVVTCSHKKSCKSSCSLWNNKLSWYK